jgi:hypothetical protein
VLTAGGSAMRVTQEVEKAGATVAAVARLVDHLEGTADLLAARAHSARSSRATSGSSRPDQASRGASVPLSADEPPTT